MAHRLLAPVVAAALLSPTTAAACGGFFCNTDPIDQSGENIVFSMDSSTGTVTTHVQINYQGDAADFAWVVPVPAVPQLELSTEQLFDELLLRTAPQFDLDVVEEGDCGGYGYPPGGYYYDYSASAGGAYADTGAASTEVLVIEQAQVGPYDTVVLQAQSSTALLDWLGENGYDLPASLDPVLQPYVANDAYFVALRLQNDKTAGDIAPLAMTYAGTKASIPIQLTSIAATPDMRLRTWVFAEARAVPESYLHVQINEAAIDWLSFGSNYEDVVTLAANEAGGHAFATDYAGPTDPLKGTLWWEGRYDTDALATLTDPVAFMDEVIRQGFPANDTLLSLLQVWMPPPAGVDATSFYNCVACYPEHTSTMSFDAAGLAAELQLYVVDPLIDAEALFTGNPWVSRLTSSLSPVEMTVDPVFVVNEDMGEVDNVHTATLVYLCDEEETSWYDAERRLQLADGRVILIPSDAWLDAHGLTVEAFLEGLTEHNALIIEQTSASGEPTVIADYSQEAGTETDDHNEKVQDLADPGAEAGEGKGCGCSTAPPTGGALWLGLVLAWFRRRR